nr:MAG: ORF7 protein [Armillaria cepistipes negative-stranded RNA virus 1]
MTQSEGSSLQLDTVKNSTISSNATQKLSNQIPVTLLGPNSPPGFDLWRRSVNPNSGRSRVSCIFEILSGESMLCSFPKRNRRGDGVLAQIPSNRSLPG